MAGSELWGCAKCATLGKTCCQRREVFVSAGDLVRIAAHAGRTGFWNCQPPADESYVDAGADPVWRQRAFRPDGTRPILHRRPDGDCTFLGAHGCTLPLEVRPLVCRLYPYTYTEKGINGVDESCPPGVVAPGGTILKVLDLRLADAIRWRQMLYTELLTGEPCDERRFDLRPAV
jgi:Fe-S-cluster containining protein